MPELASVRTNLTFEVNYENNLLEPSVELIMLLHHPEYKMQKGKIIKGNTIKEARFKTSVKGINILIGELQATAIGLAKYEQLGASFNAIIKGSEEAERNAGAKNPEPDK